MAPPSEEASKLKAQANEAFQKQCYDEAITLYGQAIAISSCDHLLYSNRSAAYAGAKKFAEALVDGRKCVELKPDFAKGYGRVGLAQFNLNQFIDAKKSYEQGLVLDPQSSVLKDGLRDTRRRLKPWIISIMEEGTASQSIVQQKICEAAHQLVSNGCTSLSFLEGHQKVLQLDLPDDVFEKHGIADEDFQQTLSDYEKVADYEVITAAQGMLYPAGNGDPERAGKLDVATLIEAHKFMGNQMRSLVEDFNQLPAETKHSIPKKMREHVAELLVSLAVEGSLKIQSEDMELAVTMNGEQLESNAEFLECQNELVQLMQLLKEPPFIEKVDEMAAKPASKSEAGAATLDVPDQRGMSSLACSMAIASALGLLVVFGLMARRAQRVRREL